MMLRAFKAGTSAWYLRPLLDFGAEHRLDEGSLRVHLVEAAAPHPPSALRTSQPTGHGTENVVARACSSTGHFVAHA
eukprot:3372384-Rhodomonas_salina.2